ncbi:MAG: hypothetical protein UX80_C0003G0022 [Candidatus Amesbacteria bacterium GW2011_GWA2_47_11b]|uniref:Uncharacterized protein n=1 Tax=Candidatus Amesbacteria bacterium GW2011_GWA2_47_11b TaxID=1618358 RepID=A0A0G1RMN3_9BACT|nr:MAG: hypothetical protein UX80_C0003G0022 [Candidatus Amesbacteria bacterium GW2011_GWA2_47_11b]
MICRIIGYPKESPINIAANLGSLSSPEKSARARRLRRRIPSRSMGSDFSGSPSGFMIWGLGGRIIQRIGCNVDLFKREMKDVGGLRERRRR